MRNTSSLTPVSAINRQKTAPIPVTRSIRPHELWGITSIPAGKVTPIHVVPFLREDAGSCRVAFSFEMHETAEILMNPVNVRVKAYMVPLLAMERFNGMDEFNKSYEGEPYREGEDVVPFIETGVFGPSGSNEILKKLGKHGKEGETHNTMYTEAYNVIHNFRLKNRSPDLYETAKRTRLQEDLAPAFWEHKRYGHIVPDFDQSKIDGEVPLNIADGKLVVKGIGVKGAVSNTPVTSVRESGATEFQDWDQQWNSADTDPTDLVVKHGAGGYPDIFAELNEQGITVSLSNIHMAKKTAAFAKLREEYQGHSDQYIIDLLMKGIRIPEQLYNQPMLVGRGETVFGMSKRYATDAGNLEESAVNGATFVDMEVNIPEMNTGGVLYFLVEILPEQLFERQQDPFLHITDVKQWPDYMRDSLDPEPVVPVTNGFMDVDHDTPEGTFGYAPLNHEWVYRAPSIGGRFFRPEVDAPFDEDRQRIWAVESQNPVLGEDFYLATQIHNKPFSDRNSDPFECASQGLAFISGLTYFGDALIEASDDYQRVLEKAPIETIDKDAP